MSDPTIRKQIYSFAVLPKDWDGHGSEAIHWQIVEDALSIVDRVESLGGVVKWVCATTDETILMKFLLRANMFKIEIDNDHSMGVALWQPEQEVMFYDYQVKEFIANL